MRVDVIRIDGQRAPVTFNGFLEAIEGEKDPADAGLGVRGIMRHASGRTERQQRIVDPPQLPADGTDAAQRAKMAGRNGKCLAIEACGLVQIAFPVQTCCKLKCI